MTKPLSPPPWFKESPWLSEAYDNPFKYEFSFVLDPIDADAYRPAKLFEWIFEQKGVGKLFRALATFAPLFPVHAYKGEPALFVSPPPSGGSNSINIVMGYDGKKALRLVGGNYFGEPSREVGNVIESKDFFSQYDSADDYEKRRLIQKVVSQSIKPDQESLVRDTNEECEIFCTMPIYLSVLTGEDSMFLPSPAVVWGTRAADFSYELLGEVK